MFQTLLDFVFPRRSLSGKEGQCITEQEIAQLCSFSVTEEAHILRERGIEHLDAIRAGASYHHAPLLKKAIHKWKYGRTQELTDVLVHILLSARLPDIPEDAVLCPVPLHWSRRFQRGFNQSQLLADAVGKEKGIEVRSLLARKKPTGFQSHRTRAQRLVSVRGAFACTTKIVPPFVVLIDDLATTGATLDSCASALKQSGARYVEAWVIAHG